jgi:hypothetical protein
MGRVNWEFSQTGHGSWIWQDFRDCDAAMAILQNHQTVGRRG